MSDKRSIFFDEWQACLRAHYVHVLRSDDSVTEPTLRHVLHQTGIADEELAALQAEGLAGRLAPESASDAPQVAESFDEGSGDAEFVPFAEDTALDAEGDEGDEEPPFIPPGQLALF
jgi:hypothetical protein